MLDIKLIRENTEDVIARLAAKGKEARSEVERIVELDAQRRAMISENEAKKAEQNRVNKLIPQYKKEGKDVTILTIGAVLYGIGAKKHWMHSVFHIFVVIGSFLQFLSIYLYAL